MTNVLINDENYRKRRVTGSENILNEQKRKITSCLEYSSFSERKIEAKNPPIT